MYSGLNDAAGTPFYFNGLPKLIYNPAAFAPAGGKTITAGVAASSGVLSPAGPKSPPAKVTYTFPKVGMFQLICNVHPGMKATVTVKPSGAPVPLSPTQVTAKALTETSAAWAKAKPLAAAPVPANTVYAGVGSTTAILGFFPRVLKVKAGTTVNFVNRSPSEVHNVDVRAGEVPARILQEDRPAPGRPGQPEPGHAALPVRHGAEGRVHATTARTTATASWRHRSRRARHSCHCRGPRR